MPTDWEEVLDVYQDGCLATYPYHRNEARLPPGWTPDERLAASARQAFGLKTAGVESPSGAIVDRSSGLTAVVLLHRETKEVVLCFGGTTAGKKVGDTLSARSKPGANFRSTLTQWGANILAGLGRPPKSYRQAEQLLASVQRQMGADDRLTGYRLRVVGHSKGGGEATYASVRSTIPVPVTTFCPAHLSDGLLEGIPPARLEDAATTIRHFSPRGDPVSGLRGLLPGLHGVGTEHHFDGIKSESRMHRHDQVLVHLKHYLESCRKPKHA